MMFLRLGMRPDGSLLPPLLAMLAALGACAPGSAATDPGAAAADPLPAREVHTVLAALETWERTLRVTGELQALEDVVASTRVAGRVEELAVDLGGQVAAGDVLARVETRDYELAVAKAEAALQAARAQLGLSVEGKGDEVDPESTAIVREAQAVLDQARQERDRLSPLVQQGIVNQSDFDAAESRFRIAESRLHGALEEVETRRAVLAQRRAELQVARKALDDTVVRAPFAGAIAARMTGTGDYLSVGAPIVRLVRFDPVRVRLSVPERDAPSVRVGQTARVTIEGGGAEAEGRIARIAPGISGGSRTLQVELELPNPGDRLRPGSFVRAEIVVDADARTLVVPQAALVRFAGIDKVIAVQDGKALETPVQVGRVEGERVEILGGLTPGTPVVVQPGDLQSGQPVVPAS